MPRQLGSIGVCLLLGLVASSSVAEEWTDTGEWGDTEQWDETNTEDKSKVDIHGSFENQLTVMVPNRERLIGYDSLRLRVDLDVDLKKGVKFRSDGVARLFVGETQFPLRDIIPAQTLTELIARDPRWQSATEENYALENELYLDNAYLKIPIRDALVILGKQPLEQGAGYAWNPTDVFTVKDMFDPTYEKEGVVALRTIVPIGDRASLDLVAAPNGTFKQWIAGGRASIRLGPISLSGVTYVTRIRETDLEGSMDAMEAAAAAGQNPDDAVIRNDAQRIAVGGDVVADIEGVRLYAEGAYNFIDGQTAAPDDWFEWVGGAEYFFPSQTHFLVEYFHYGHGSSQSGGTYGFNDWMSLLAMDRKMLGKDFLFESIDQPFAKFWTVGFSSFQSLSDASAALMADLRFAFAEDLELWLLASTTAGQPEDFLSAARGQGWLRLKAYF